MLFLLRVPGLGVGSTISGYELHVKGCRFRVAKLQVG